MNTNIKYIIKNIASIQVEALTNIKDNLSTTEPELLRKLLQITDEEVIDSINQHIKLYEGLQEMPQLIKTLNEYQLYICSHILFKMEDEWIAYNSEGVYGTWEIIYRESHKFHPELTLII